MASDLPRQSEAPPGILTGGASRLQLVTFLL